MKQDFLQDTMTQLDEDILEKAAKLRYQAQNRRRLLPQTKIQIAAACAVFIVMLGIAVTQENLLTSFRLSTADSYSAYNPDAYSVSDHYSYFESTAFVKVKPLGIDDIIYWEPAANLPYVLLECTVLEDYYEHLEKDTVIRVPISLNMQYEDKNKKLQNGIFDTEKIKNTLLASDYLLLYIFNIRKDGLFIRESDTETKIDVEFSETHDILTVTGDFRYVEIENLTENVVLTRWQIIPTKDDKIDLNAITTLFDAPNALYSPYESIENYQTILDDGMPLAEAEKNLRELYQINKKENSLTP